MNVERQVRRALWRMTFWRFVAHLFTIPETVCEALAEIFGRLRDPFLGLEYDAARRYHALTGVDIGKQTNDSFRYCLDEEELSE